MHRTDHFSVPKYRVTTQRREEKKSFPTFFSPVVICGPSKMDTSCNAVIAGKGRSQQSGGKVCLFAVAAVAQMSRQARSLFRPHFSNGARKLTRIIEFRCFFLPRKHLFCIFLWPLLKNGFPHIYLFKAKVFPLPSGIIDPPRHLSNGTRIFPFSFSFHSHERELE